MNKILLFQIENKGINELRLNSLLILFAIVLTLSGCGGGGSTTTSTADTTFTEDTTAPIITVIGENPLNIAQGSTYIDDGAIAVDDRDGVVTVITTGSVDTAIIGNYILTYTATDSANNTATATRTVNVIDSDSFVSIFGTITYDKVPVNLNYVGLDYDSITKEPAKLVVVEAIDSSNTTVGFTRTDQNGAYSLQLLKNVDVKIRVSAKMIQAGTPSWDVKVVDNTNSNALYVMEGSLASSGTTDSQRDLNAPSGWDGSSYTSARIAAPFAMLDNIYDAMQKVLGANAQTVFPELKVNWSTNNVASVSIDYPNGLIITSHYINGNLYILGDADTDTDEYDDHVIAHEWGHYYEDKFSRSDSIGGQHSGEDILDIRVAFGEGWGNAFSGIALDNPIYFDTLGDSQASGFNFDVESGTSTSMGWYSEASIERILYDLYDNTDDGTDTLSLGFKPIHDVFTGAEKTTPAFTSIFTFIKALKNENSADAEDIDSIVSSENIATIIDIYGTGRTNKPLDYPYNHLTLGNPLAIQIGTVYGTYNKLSNRKYVRFTLASSGTYTITVQQTNGTNSNPNFYLFDTSPFRMVNFSESTLAGIEQKSVSLTAGEYLLDISEFKNIADVQLTVTIN